MEKADELDETNGVIDFWFNSNCLHESRKVGVDSDDLDCKTEFIATFEFNLVIEFGVTDLTGLCKTFGSWPKIWLAIIISIKYYILYFCFINIYVKFSTLCLWMIEKKRDRIYKLQINYQSIHRFKSFNLLFRFAKNSSYITPNISLILPKT